jgi:ubiquitin-like protein 5
MQGLQGVGSGTTLVVLGGAWEVTNCHVLSVQILKSQNSIVVLYSNTRELTFENLYKAHGSALDEAPPATRGWRAGESSGRAGAQLWLRLHLRGGDGGGESRGKYSSVFLEDAARRKSSASSDLAGASLRPERTPQEILRGAVRREAAAATAHEGAAAPRLTIAELRDKVRALGASEGRVRACTERRDLDDLLTGLQDDGTAVDRRENGKSSDARCFQIPKMAVDIAESVTRWKRLDAESESDQSSDHGASTAAPPSNAPESEAEICRVDAKIGKLKQQLYAKLHGAHAPSGTDTHSPQRVRRHATPAPPHAGSAANPELPSSVSRNVAVDDGGFERRGGGKAAAEGGPGGSGGPGGAGGEEVVEEEEEDWGPALEVREGRSSDEYDPKLGLDNESEIDYDARTVAEAERHYAQRHDTHTPSSRDRHRMEMENWLSTRPVSFLRQQLTKYGISYSHTVEKWELKQLLRPHLEEIYPLSQSAPGASHTSGQKGSTAAGGELGNQCVPETGTGGLGKRCTEEEEEEETVSSAEAHRHGLAARKRPHPRPPPTPPPDRQQGDRSGWRKRSREEASVDSSDEYGGGAAARARGAWIQNQRRFTHRDEEKEEGEERTGNAVPMHVGKNFKPWMYAEYGEDGGGGKIMIHVNDRLGSKTSLLVFPDITIKQLKQKVAEKLYKDPHSLLIKKASIVFRDQLLLSDYEVHDGYNLEIDYKGLYDLE